MTASDQPEPDLGASAPGASAAPPVPAAQPGDGVTPASSGAAGATLPSARAPVGIGSAALVLLALLGVALGLGLRFGLGTLEAPMFSWEAEGMLASLEVATWPHEPGLRPAGYELVADRLGDALQIADVAGARRLALGLSLVALLGALASAGLIATRLGFARRRTALAMAGGAWIWALHPTWIQGSLAPTPELVAAAALAWLPLGVVAASSRREIPGTILLGLLLGVLFCVGGLIWAAAGVVGLLVYLLPVPRLRDALRGLAAILIAVVTWAWCEQLSAPPKLESVDSAWAYASLEWLDPGHPRYMDLPLPLGKRHGEVIALVGDALAEREDGLELVRSAAARVRNLSFSPGRFGPLIERLPVEFSPELARAARWALAIWETLLRGGCLLFALVVARVYRTSRPSSGWPRGAFAAFVMVAFVLSGLFALSPVAALPLDALLLGVAAAGLVGAGSGGARTRWGFFGLGGTLLVSFLFVTGLSDVPLSKDLWDRGERFDQSQRVVRLLAQPEDLDALQELQIAALFADANTPLLRAPRLALAHATAASHLDPYSEDVIGAMAQALTSLGRYTEAARLVSQAKDSSAVPSKRLDVLLHWVQEMERVDRRPAVR